MSDMMARMTLMAKIAQAFTPSAPIDQQTLFAGRLDQIQEVMSAIAQKGQHVILFGERGVGKTSLATVISRVNRGMAIMPSSGSINCDETTTFSDLWHRLFRDIPINAGKKQAIGFASPTSSVTGNLSDYLPQNVTPDDVRSLLSKIGKSILVIDEIDRIEDKRTAKLLADTIKTLSDHAVDATLILVGVADSVETLIGNHQSIERALVQIQMPRMNQQELEQIIDNGANHAGMTVEPKARKKIAILSQGLPHYTHLLSLHAFQNAAAGRETEVKTSDVSTAIDKALEKAQQSTIAAYHKATSSSRENLYPQVLLACAMAHTDNLGYFAAGDIRAPLGRIMSKDYAIPAFSQHLNAFCEDSRGPILQKTGVPRRYRFRFLNPLMQPYVLLDGVRRKLIKESDLDK